MELLDSVDISIIVPAYNEEETITYSIKAIADFFKNKTAEIIIVDDGSSDRTFAKLRELNLTNLKILRNFKNFGKGYSVKMGVLHSSGKLVLFTDADLSTPLEEFNKLLKKIQDGYDIALGSRNIENAIVEKPQPFLRVMLGKFYGLLALPIVSWKVKDSQCGFKLFKGDSARQIFSKTCINGYAFDIEVLLIAKRMGLKIVEVGVRWRNNEKSKIRLFSFVYIDVLLDLLKIYFKKLLKG